MLQVLPLIKRTPGPVMFGIGSAALAGFVYLVPVLPATKAGVRKAWDWDEPPSPDKYSPWEAYFGLAGGLCGIHAGWSAMERFQANRRSVLLLPLALPFVMMGGVLSIQLVKNLTPSVVDIGELTARLIVFPLQGLLVDVGVREGK